MSNASMTNKTFRRGLLFSIVLGFLIALSSCGQQPSSSGQSSSSTRTVSIDASWSTLYEDVKSAKTAADVVVLGTIESVKDVTQSGPSLIFTDFVFNIERSIVDPHHLLQSSAIIIHQTGGVVNGVKYEVDDDPLFQINEHALLFLHIYQPGYAFVIGGPSGRFIVQNGMVQPRNNQDGMTSMRNRSVALADFITQIQNA